MQRLIGRRLLLTRSAEDSADWVASLTAEGATPVVFPCIRSEAVGDAALAVRLADKVGQADWLVCTSRRGVDAVAELIGTTLPDRLRLAAVGTATAARCNEHFGRVDLVGEGTAALLGQALARHPAMRPGTRALLALARNAGSGLENSLAAVGALVERVDVYCTVPAKPLLQRQPLSSLGCDAVIFASPTAVAGFANQIHVDTAIDFVTIGPSTSAAVHERHWIVAAEAEEPSLSGIIASLLETAHV
jgi:uroporphyrinogen-III synthase